MLETENEELTKVNRKLLNENKNLKEELWRTINALENARTKMPSS